MLAFALLAACGQSQKAEKPDLSRPERLAEIYRTGNPLLIASATDQLVEHGFESTVRAVSDTEGGAQSIRQAISALSHAKELETNPGTVLKALAILDPLNGRKSQVWLALGRPSTGEEEDEGGSSLESRRLFDAAGRFDRAGEQFATLLDPQTPGSRTDKLRAAVENGVRIGGTARASLLRQLSEIRGDDAANAELGLALILLDRSGVSAEATAGHMSDLARANGYMEVRDYASAGRLFRSVRARLPSEGRDGAAYLEALDVAVFGGFPRPLARELATGVVVQNYTSAVWRTLEKLDVPGHEAQALGSIRKLATKDQWLRLRPAMTYLSIRQMERPGVSAFCESKLGREEVITAPESGPGRTLVLGIRPSTAADIAAAAFSRNPSVAESKCGQALVETAARRLDPVLANLRLTRPEVLAFYRERLQYVPKRAQKCLDVELVYRRSEPKSLDGLTLEQLSEYLIHCSAAAFQRARGAIASNSLDAVPPQAILATRSGWRLRALLIPASIPSIASSESSSEAPDPIVVSQQRLELRELIGARYDSERLDHYALLSDFLIARSRFSAEDRSATEAAAQIALLTSSHAVLTWLSDRLTNYPPTDAAEEAKRFGAAVEVMSAAWAGVDSELAEQARWSDAMGESSDKEPRSPPGQEQYNAISEELQVVYERRCGSAPGGAKKSVWPLRLVAQGIRNCIPPEQKEAARAIATSLEAKGTVGLARLIEGELSTGVLGLAKPILVTLLVHLLVWCILIVIYPGRGPLSRFVQANLFWNPAVRKYAGLFYVQPLLLAVPMLRDRLLRPFSGLVSDAALPGFRQMLYFAEVPATRSDRPGETGSIGQLVPELRGQIWLEGVSGAGKSWFLRDLTLHSKRPVAFLNATSCTEGVTQAIVERFGGASWIADTDFLNSIIHAGALAIVVDGLNEVSPELRARIVDFANARPAAHVLLATQPIKLARPVASIRVTLEPLHPAQILTFLMQLAPDVATGAAIEEYRSRAENFVGALSGNDGLRAIISNPMDLRSVGSLLAANIAPDLLRLQEQQVKLAEEDYRSQYDAEFPMRRFSRAVYELRAQDRPITLGPGDWPEERGILAEHKLLLLQHGPDGAPMWRFRHDKITAYFLLRAFMDDPGLVEAHLSDNRFLDAYVLMSRLLPPARAEQLLTRITWAGGREQNLTMTQAVISALDAAVVLRTDETATRETAVQP